MNHSPKNPLQALTSLGLPLLAAVALTLATGSINAGPNEEHPPQRQWVYKEYADVVTGDPYPAALLMSRNVGVGLANSASVGQGYLSVGNYSKRPMEVTMAWDEPPSKPSTINCKPGGCEVTVRFGTTAATKFTAVRDKYSPTLVLQDGRAFVAAAARHTGAIEVQVETLGAGLVTHQFLTASRLQVEKLGGPRK